MKKIIQGSRHADVTFHRDGRIDLTAHVVKALDLHEGDVINIAELGERYPEHFIFVARRAVDATGRHSGICRPVKRGGNYQRVYSKCLTDYILHRCQASDSQALRVGAPTQLTGIGQALPLIIPHKKP